MLIVLVHITVKADQIDAFLRATAENAAHSILEPGIARFDLIRQQDDFTRFVLIEAYRTPDAQQHHRETAHYARWRDTVADMMAEPRAGVKYISVLPDDTNW